MTNGNGTPRTLDEAIMNAITIGPLSEAQERMYHHIRDFMAQKFGIAYLGISNKDELKVVQTLFETLTRREK